MNCLGKIKNSFNKVADFIKIGVFKVSQVAKYVHKFVFTPFNLFIKKFICKAPRLAACAVSVIVLVFAASTVALATGATVAYDVMLNGKKIATVKEQTVLAEAEILAAELVNNSKCNALIAQPQLVCTVAEGRSLVTAEELSGEIVDNSEEIVKMAVLSIDNVNVSAESDICKIDAALSEYLENYSSDHYDMEGIEFSSSLNVSEVYMPKSTAKELPSIKEYINNGENVLPVQSYTTVVEVCSIDYTTVSVKSDQLLAGSTKVVKNGEKGSKEVTYKVSYMDGKVAEKVELSSKILSQPVAEEVIVGTKRVIAADKNGDAPMCWPVKRVEGSYVSSYVGDQRGHNGMDIAAKIGTPIYAASAGTVVFASSDSSGYGKYIIIDHGNGIKTLYAHCNALFVNVGDTVSEGEHIASVGNTGYSTGFHLHFEVRINDNPVNPVAYIGYN